MKMILLYRVITRSSRNDRLRNVNEQALDA